MELTYIYHSGFALSGDGFTVIMDYYRDSEDGQAQADLYRQDRSDHQTHH